MARLATTNRRSPPWGLWTIACGAGETLGMAAAAGTAGVLLATVGEPHDWPSAVLVWVGSTAGGAVEGVAIALLQFAVLRRWLTRLSRVRWVAATTAVALAGWALGMAPSSLLLWQVDEATGSTAPASGPPLWAMPLAGAALGAMLGAVFGAAQSSVLRGHVAHPRRWVGANAAGWSAALAVMMTGASLPSVSWSLARLLALGAVTGIVAGLVIGAITGLFLPALDDTAPRTGPRVNRLVLWWLRSPGHRVLSGAVLDLRYPGRRSGRWYALPVQYARDGDRLVLCPGNPERKVWWRSLVDPVEVDVNLRGQVRRGTARVVRPPDQEYASAAGTYRARWPRVRLAGAAPLVVVDLEAACSNQAPRYPMPRRSTAPDLRYRLAVAVVMVMAVAAAGMLGGTCCGSGAGVSKSGRSESDAAQMPPQGTAAGSTTSTRPGAHW